MTFISTFVGESPKQNKMGKRNLDSGNKEEKKEEKRSKTVEGSPKMYSCGEEGCDYKSKWKKVAKSHKANIHDVDVTFYVCDVDGCDYKAKVAGNLKRHKKGIHGIS